MGEQEEIQTVTTSGKPVEERIPGIFAARAVCDYLDKSDDEDSYRRATLKGMIDGNAPYPANRLRELGLGNMINVNFLEMRAILDAKAAAHYELFFEVPTLITVTVRPLGPAQENVQLPDYGAIIAEEFSSTLLDWSGFLPLQDVARREADAYGIGGATFQDEWDWRPKPFKRANIRFDPKATTDIDQLQVFKFDDEMSVEELSTKISDKVLAQDEGWNVSAVEKLLVSQFVKGEGPDGTKYNLPTWEEIQQKIRNNDWSQPYTGLEPVRLTHLLVTEIKTGDVSHYIFPKNAPAVEDKFLFRAVNRFRKMSQVLWALPYNNGDGYLKSVRGLASMLYHHCDLSNRFLGRLFDAGFLTASLLLQPKSTLDLSKIQITRLGVFTVIPPELTAVQSSFQPQVTQLIQLRDLSSSIMKNNTGVYRQHPELAGERQPEKTARQVAEETAKEQRMEKANVAFDLERLQWLYREMFRRMTNPAYVMAEGSYPGKVEAQQFIQRCVSRGVPLELMLMPGALVVHITRPIGMGSWGVKLDISNQVLQARGLFDEHGRDAAIRDWLAPRVGYQNVDRYKPLRNRDQVMSNEHSIATLENNDLVEGQSVVVGSDQKHAYHFYVHGLRIQMLVKVLEEKKGAGIDPAKEAKYLTVALPHMSEHLQYLSLDPTRKDFVATGTQLIQSGVKLLQMFQRYVEKLAKAQQAQAEAQQAQLDEALTMDQQVEMAKIKADAETERMKQESLNGMRAEKTKAQLQISAAKAQEDLRRKAELQSADIAMRAKKLDAELELQRVAKE